jgi:flagellar L-ring protein precursor FlgH
MKALCGLLLLAAPAAAQSLFAQPPAIQPVNISAHGNDPAASLYGVSAYAVQPAKPRQYKVHDLVTIIVEETVKQSAQQETKADKTYRNQVQVNGLIDPMKLLELQLRAGSTTNLTLADIANNAKFDGKGNYQRNDQFSMKIQAEVIDLKPNGVIVLEARKTIDKNGELTSTVLSGNCRLEDITTSNTVLSTQLANLTLLTKNEGEVNNAGKKGWIPRVLDTVFNF